MIARDLGMTHAELMSRTSAREMTWWKALYEVEHGEREHAKQAKQQGVGRGRRR